MNDESLSTKMNELFKLYCQNSFGSVSKRELDIFLFNMFQETGMIKGKDSWDLAQELKISRTKAQTLLYESSIRYSQKVNVKIQQLLNDPPRLQDGGTIWMMVDDKFVREQMRSYLRSKGIVTDLSFASEIVKMPPEGYWELQKKYNPQNVSKLKKDEFVEKLKKIPGKFVGKLLSDVAGEEAGESIGTMFSLLFEQV
ncbi:MAG: hypothetical protein MJY87_08945 [Fibrobacter sp.]|nr:hypothetical protein [Fibrobacter sp.]